MSALSLQYPMKPIELSDDLEGFVHVLVHNVLRFHYHNLTVIHSENPTQEELFRINGTAEVLANFVSQYFFTSLTLPDGSTVGGEAKMSKIKSGDPGFHILATEDPLARLISDLFALLKEHYAAVDMASLASYILPEYAGPMRIKDAPITARKPKPTNSTSHAPSPNVTVTNAATLIPTPAPTSTAASSAPVSFSLNSPAWSTLNDHGGISEIFERAFAANARRATALAKTPDQFLGLKAFDVTAPQKLSGSRRKSSEGTSAGKDNERAAKKARTDSQAPLDTVAEEGS